MNLIYKILGKRKNKLATLMAVITVISFFPMSGSSSRASELEVTCAEVYQPQVLSDTKDELEKAKKEKEQKEQELAAAQNQVNQTNASLSSLKSQQNSYEGQMNTLNTELQLVADNLTVLEIEKQLKEMEIEETQATLSANIALQNQQYENMKSRIKFLYEKGDNLYLEVLFSSKDFGQFLNYADYVEKLNQYDRQQLDEYIATGQVISENMAQLESELAEVEELERQAKEEQGKVTGLISQTAENIANTADSINDVQKQADQYEAQLVQKAAEADAANKEYEAIKKQYDEEMRLAELARASAWRDISEVTFEEGDRYLLANLIYCEAGNQPYEGKVAVGAVVINRLLSSRYPDTVTGVIYQYKQFAPVLDGHLALALANDKATESCYQAADAAMSGTTNVGNCLYFRTPIPGLEGLPIGDHIFY